jgi:hypothetical protein
MKLIKSFESFRILEKSDYEETSWTDGGIKITIQDVQNFLDTNDVGIINIPVDEIFHMCCHRDKTDKATIERSERSSLDYPIIIAKGLDGNWTMILDGHHRLFKAHNHGIKYIKARVLDLKESPDEYRKIFY